MEVTEQIVSLDSNWFSAERDVSRSKGLHLSHVIDFIEFLEQKKYREFAGGREQALQAYATAGFCWERVIERLVEYNPVELWEWLFGRVLAAPENPKIIRPGEQCMIAGFCPKCEGRGHQWAKAGVPGEKCEPCNGTGHVLIYLTPDGYHIDDILLEEWKYTTKSSNNDIRGPKFRRWIGFQIPCYLKALGLTTCRLRVYFARGNYTDGVPIWKEYLIEYTQQEIDDTWDMIARHALLMREKGIA